MIRMTLRQFRIQALIGAILLILAAVYLVRLGGDIRAGPNSFLRPWLTWRGPENIVRRQTEMNQPGKTKIEAAG